jgi:hypothetical protein
MNNYAFNKLANRDVPYEIKQGLIDGCSSSLWSRGNSFYRYMTTFRQNPDLIKNPLYKFAWARSYNVCFQMNNVDTFGVLGARFVNNNMSGMFDIRDAKDWTGLPVGGNPNYAATFVLDESSAKGMFGHSDSNKSENFFGFFGTCQFC